jgi:hypothetical protein
MKRYSTPAGELRNITLMEHTTGQNQLRYGYDGIQVR